MSGGQLHHQRGVEAWIEQTNTRLAALERSIRLPFSAIDTDSLEVLNDGQILVKDTSGQIRVSIDTEKVTVKDDNNVTRVVLGEIAANVFGVSFADDTGTTRFKVDDDGPSGSIVAANRVGAFASVDATEGWVQKSGPEVTGVKVGPSGQMFVLLVAYLGPQVNRTGYFGVNVSGATSVSPDETQAASSFGSGGRTAGDDIRPNSFMYFLMTGLNEGVHTVSSRVRVTGTDVTDDCYLSSRELVAMPI